MPPPSEKTRQNLEKSKLKISAICKAESDKDSAKPEYNIKSGPKELRISAPADSKEGRQRISRALDELEMSETSLGAVDTFEDLERLYQQKRAERDHMELRARRYNASAGNDEAAYPLGVLLMQWAGMVMSAAWIGFCYFHAARNGGFSGMTPPEFGAVMAGILSPVALFWMIFSYFLRSADAGASSGHPAMYGLEKEARDLGVSSNHVIQSISRARQGLRSEVRDLVGVSKKTEFHIDRLAENMNERAERLLVLMEALEKRATALDKKDKNRRGLMGRCRQAHSGACVGNGRSDGARCR